MRVFLGINEKNFGDVLRDYRKRNKFTQKKVADYLGVDRTTYTKYETSRIPELDVILRLCVFYNVSVDEFFGDFFAEKIESQSVGTLRLSSSSINNDKKIDSLTVNEEKLVKLYRECVNKSKMLEMAREIWLEDSELNIIQE